MRILKFVFDYQIDINEHNYPSSYKNLYREGKNKILTYPSCYDKNTYRSI